MEFSSLRLRLEPAASSRGLLVVAVTAVMLLLVYFAGRPRALPLGVHTIRADDALLRQARDLEAQYIVQVFSWHDIQPSPERWDWEYTDWLVRAADYYGLEIVARLDKPPPWAVDDSTALSAPPRRTEDYAEFARRVAERYRGRISAYILWNEPNLAIEWGNRKPDAVQYAALLRAGAQAVRAADPDARVIAAAPAPTNENSDRAQDDRQFLRELYAAGAADSFDALAAHPYAFGLPPDAPAAANDGLNLKRISSLREIMQENGDSAKPIWITEFGYPTEQPPGYADRVVNEEQQAQYLAEAYNQARDELPYVERFTVWNLVRDLPADDEQFGYTLLRADGSTKPGYHAVQQLQKQSPLLELASKLFSSSSAPESPSSNRVFSVLARDAVVHLGDSEYPAPFFPLYKTRNPAVEWKGEFYLTPGDLEGDLANRPWTLAVELMQVNDFDSRVWVNDVPVEPAFLPAEDFQSRWVTAQFRIPAGVLHAGYNAVSIHDGKLLPALQQAGFVWDEVQLRNVRIIAP